MVVVVPTPFRLLVAGQSGRNAEANAAGCADGKSIAGPDADDEAPYRDDFANVFGVTIRRHCKVENFRGSVDGPAVGDSDGCT